MYCVNIIPSLEWFMQFSTDVEAKMNAVERLMVRVQRDPAGVRCLQYTPARAPVPLCRSSTI